jgi:hypothetical protein
LGARIPRASKKKFNLFHGSFKLFLFASEVIGRDSFGHGHNFIFCLAWIFEDIKLAFVLFNNTGLFLQFIDALDSRSLPLP